MIFHIILEITILIYKLNERKAHDDKSNHKNDSCTYVMLCRLSLFNILQLTTQLRYENLNQTPFLQTTTNFAKVYLYFRSDQRYIKFQKIAKLIQNMQSSNFLAQGPDLLKQLDIIAKVSQKKNNRQPLSSNDAFVWGVLAATSQAGTLEFLYDRVSFVAQLEKDGIIDANDKGHIYQAFAKNINFNVEGYIQQKMEDPTKLPLLVSRDSKEESKLTEELIKQIQQEEEILAENRRRLKEIEESGTCKICLEKLEHKNFTLLSECGHIYHNECLGSYAKSKIDGRELPIKCPEPGCMQEILPVDIEEMVDKKTFEKFKEFALKNYFDMHSEEVSWCPTADCPFVFINDDKITDFSCPVCKKRYCFTCMVPYHNGQTCKEYQVANNWNKSDDAFIKFVNNRKFKQCPTCKYWIEKTQGCNSMHCRCGFSFCYGCGQQVCRCGGGVIRPLRPYVDRPRLSGRDIPLPIYHDPDPGYSRFGLSKPYDYDDDDVIQPVRRPFNFDVVEKKKMPKPGLVLPQYRKSDIVSSKLLKKK